MAPSQLPNLFRSVRAPALLLLPGMRSRPTQIVPCCAANSAIEINEFNLSPLCAGNGKACTDLVAPFQLAPGDPGESSKNCFSLALIRPL